MKIFIFLVGIGWDWGILGSNNLMNWWDINPPFMYCVFHHISDHLQRLILFWQFYKKVGLRSDPPPWLGQNPKFVKGLPLGKTSKRKTHFNSGIARITQTPPTPQFGQLYRLFSGWQKRRFVRMAEKNTDDDNNCCHDNFDQNFGNFDDNDDKKYWKTYKYC